MSAIEAGCDRDSQTRFSQALGDRVRIGRGRQEIATETQEHSHASRDHGFDCFDRVVAGFARRSDPELPVQRGIEGFGHVFGDAHGAIALNIGMPAHAEQARVGASDVASDEQQVGQFADIVDGVFVLRQAHCPARNRTSAGGQHLRRLFNLRAFDAGFTNDYIPIRGFDVAAILRKSIGVLVEEFAVEGIACQKALGESLEERDVAVDPHLQIKIG